MISESNAQVVSELRSAAATIEQGVHGIGLERILSSSQVGRAITTLSEGDYLAVADLLIDISGQTSNLYDFASTSLLGSEALKAIAQGYAMVLVKIRDNHSACPREEKEQSQAIVKILKETQDVTLHWVQNGRIDIDNPSKTGEDHALTLIAQDFLVSPELRRIAIIPTFSTCVVICSVLRLWLGRQSSSLKPSSDFQRK